MLNMIRMVLGVVALFVLANLSLGQESESCTLNKHTAKIVNGDLATDIPCTESLVRLLIVSARNAGNHEDWKTIAKKIKPKRFITFRTDAPGPYKAHLGSRGFSGIRSITVEIEKPYRVMLENADEMFVAKLAEDSDILHANRALWQTSMALQK